MFKEMTRSVEKMEESSDSYAYPYIQQVMKNCKMLDILLALASSIQVLGDEYV